MVKTGIAVVLATTIGAAAAAAENFTSPQARAAKSRYDAEVHELASEYAEKLAKVQSTYYDELLEAHKAAVGDQTEVRRINAVEGQLRRRPDQQVLAARIQRLADFKDRNDEVQKLKAFLPGTQWEWDNKELVYYFADGVCWISDRAEKKCQWRVIAPGTVLVTEPLGGPDARITFTDDYTYFLFVGSGFYRAAKLIRPLSTAPGQTVPATKCPDEPRNQVFLDDMQEVRFGVGYGELGKYGKTGYPTADAYQEVWMKVSHALSMLPHDRRSSFVEYSLDGKFSAFTATAALSNRIHPRKAASPMTFMVFGDGERLWQSRPLQQLGEGHDCSVDIRGVRLLRLQVDCAGSKNDGMTVWINPLLTSRGDGQQLSQIDPIVGRWDYQNGNVCDYTADGWVVLNGEPIGLWRLRENRTYVVAFLNNFAGGTSDLLELQGDGQAIVATASAGDTFRIRRVNK